MNILYIHTHDTGRYIQPYGYGVPTPNLQQLAEEGTLFRHAFCSGPTCSPSRAAMLTGMSPHSNGMIGLAHRGFELKDYNKHLVQFLNRHGYETVLSGVQHETTWTGVKKLLGYQRVLTPETDKSFAAVDLGAANAAADYLQEKHDRPFFLSFGMVNTHRDFPEIGEDVNPNYLQPPYPMADTDENRRDFAAFVTGLKTVDQCVGIVLNALRKAQLEEDTFIFFTTDHGIAFPRMKCHLYDSGIGVSLIVKYPGNKMQGQAVDAMVSHVDLFPTLLDVLGLEKPEWLEGKSFLPILEGKTEKVNEEVFSEVTFHAAYEPMRCIRTERYKLIRYFEDGGFIPANCDDGIAKEHYNRAGYFQGSREMDELFDLALDPVERVNLAYNMNYKEIYDELTGKLEDWMRRTNDLLLLGPVAKPEGAKANKRSCYSPKEKDFE